MKSNADWVRTIALLWAGIVIGCSFVATPAKFYAPSLTLSTALEVGRVTFRALLAAEIILLVCGVVLLVHRRQRLPGFWIAGLVLAVQWLAVMPLLNIRTDAVIQGRPANGPPYHVFYIVLEAIKVVILLATVVRERQYAQNSDQASL
ncbi:MAG: hypothetical protein IT206_05785 [Fimbriimonadaceae bacterium]|nr:hypothetical protein [Fimbriimonadaceae bacterium]